MGSTTSTPKMDKPHYMKQKEENKWKRGWKMVGNPWRVRESFPKNLNINIRMGSTTSTPKMGKPHYMKQKEENKWKRGWKMVGKPWRVRESFPAAT